jgi:hypothetical protein
VTEWFRRGGGVMDPVLILLGFITVATCLDIGLTLFGFYRLYERLNILDNAVATILQPIVDRLDTIPGDFSAEPVNPVHQAIAAFIQQKAATINSQRDALGQFTAETLGPKEV